MALPGLRNYQQNVGKKYAPNFAKQILHKFRLQ